jgi:ATP-binding cassette subfamily C protein
VRLDGASYADWPSDILGRHIGYLPQQPSLIAGTIMDNISRFARYRGVEPDAIASGVIEAARQAGVHELILRLPQGYDTVLGSSGAGLSTGQSQRIALARALYGTPPLLVLDEPNAALDQEGEAALMTMLAIARERGAAILMIAHRGPVLTIADRVLLLRGGQIDRIGPPAELLGDIARTTGHPRPVAVPDAPADAAAAVRVQGDAA